MPRILRQAVGEPVQKFIEKRINLVGTLLLVVIVGGFLLASMIGRALAAALATVRRGRKQESPLPRPLLLQ